MTGRARIAALLLPLVVGFAFDAVIVVNGAAAYEPSIRLIPSPQTEPGCVNSAKEVGIFEISIGEPSVGSTDVLWRHSLDLPLANKSEQLAAVPVLWGVERGFPFSPLKGYLSEHGRGTPIIFDLKMRSVTEVGVTQRSANRYEDINHLEDRPFEVYQSAFSNANRSRSQFSLLASDCDQEDRERCDSQGRKSSEKPIVAVNEIKRTDRLRSDYPTDADESDAEAVLIGTFGGLFGAGVVYAVVKFLADAILGPHKKRKECERRYY